ncbi:MAG: hypothetical protein QOJ62_117 [Actinomycetota bacterium]|nr:hypothetical protein [Actinomycetota bacterium]
MGDLPNFLPSTHGLHYANSWASAPVVKIPTPFGDIDIGDAKHGLCGGMTFAVRDLFEAGRTPPPGATNPASTSPAFGYITKRLIDSFELPHGVARYYEWMNLPSGDEFFIHGTSRRTIEQSMPTIRATIDSGHPCPIGIVCAHSTNPQALGENHQVLAYGYADVGSTTTVRIYDCNHPDDDAVAISFDHTHPHHTTKFSYSYDDHTVFGFFRTSYAPRDPSPLFNG